MIDPFVDVIQSQSVPPAPFPDTGNWPQRMIRVAMKVTAPLAARLPSGYLLSVIRNILLRTLARLSPEQGLRLLLELDNELYEMQSERAIAWGGGIHPKVRFLRYADFFAAHVNSGQRVLDVGCGYGVVAEHLAGQGARVVAVDFDAEKIRVARERATNSTVEYRVTDALTLRDESFDVVVLSNVLEHLPKRAEFLARLIVSTNPTQILIRVPLFERDWRVPLKKDLNLEWRLDPTHETEFTVASFVEETKAANLRLLSLEVRWGEIWAVLEPSKPETPE